MDNEDVIISIVRLKFNAIGGVVYYG